MKISIIYESKTGNTKAIAHSLRDACEENHIVSFESVEEALEKDNILNDADLYFLGSWTDKGSCGDLMKEYCKDLSNKKIGIFGTAGFGGSTKYYESLANMFAHEIPDTNNILGSFYSQGKMPIGIRNRYLSMLEKNPDDEKIKTNIENFDLAKTHPDSEDLLNSKIFAKRIIEKLKLTGI